MNPKILIVDDEPDLVELVRFNLKKEGYEVATAASGEAALASAAADPPDLVILDLMLPGLDGLSVCRELKARPRTAAVPVIMLTAKGEEADVVAGLEVGADDYVVKPFSPRVLLARVRAVLRRRARDQAETGPLNVHGLAIDPARRAVTAADGPVDLTATEFALLHFLARRPGWVFTRGQIIAAVKGDGYAVTDRAVDVQVLGLRKKLGPAGELIETVRGVGYRFRD